MSITSCQLMLASVRFPIFSVFDEGCVLFYTGMHSVWDHVCKWKKGSAHGQKPLLWWRELLHHPSGRGNGLMGPVKPICPSQSTTVIVQPSLLVLSSFAESSLMIQIPSFLSLVLFFSFTSALVFQTLHLSQWEEEETGMLTLYPSSLWPTVSSTSQLLLMNI